MASWPAREKRAPVVMVGLLEKATRRLQMAGWRPPLLVTHQARATFRRALLAQPEQQWDRLARAFFAQGQQL